MVKASNIKNEKTETLMAQAQQLYDLIYNVECYSVGDMVMLEMLEREIVRRGYSVVEQNTLTFVESLISTN
jgi:capsular polysaccharide biosynthesis protein